MTTPQQALYLQAAQNFCQAEVALVPWTHVFVTFTFTFTLFIALQRLVPGVGILPFIVTLITLLWYIVTIIVNLYRDYAILWDRRPDYRQFARCSLNKEYNEHLALKFVIINVLSQKLVACMLAWDASPIAIKIFRGFMFLVKLLMTPVLVARGVAALGASIGMGWAHCYFFIVSGLSAANSSKLQWNPGMLWLGAAESMVTGSDEEQDNAAAIMTAAEGAMVEAGEDVPTGSPTGESSASKVSMEGEAEKKEGEETNEPAAPSTAADTENDKHAKLRFFAHHFDSSSLLPKLLFVLLYSIQCYAFVIMWDWRYDQNGISYSQSFSTFDVYRPTMQTLYDKSDSLTDEQKAYIGSLWA